MEIEMMQHIHVLVDICFRGKCGPIFEFIPHVCRLYSPSPDLFLLPRTYLLCSHATLTQLNRAV